MKTEHGIQIKLHCMLSLGRCELLLAQMLLSLKRFFFSSESFAPSQKGDNLVNKDNDTEPAISDIYLKCSYST